MRVSQDEFRSLDLEVHSVLGDVPLHDVWVVELPGGGEGRTLADVEPLAREPDDSSVNQVVRFLFWLRLALGRLFGWDDSRYDADEESYMHRLREADRARSLEPPGSRRGPFRLVYRLERESLEEVRNATAHAFLSTALERVEGGYRLYLAIYVKPVSRLTPLYMALIDPFRRLFVYPSLIRRIRHRWLEASSTGSPGRVG